MLKIDDLVESYTNYMNFWEDNQKIVDIYFRLNEGLIHTYPINHIEKALKNEKWDNHYDYKVFQYRDLKPESWTASIIFHGGDVSNDLSKLKKILRLHGYHIGYTVRYDKSSQQTNDAEEAKFWKFSIEPKFTGVSDVEGCKFYHISYQVFVDKIEKIGLTPRNSETSFDHPGNRIYLLKTNDSVAIDSMKKDLSKNRLNNLPERLFTPRGRKSMDFYIQSRQYENMVLYKVDVEGLKIYEDPLIKVSENTAAYFTMQNIPPEKLKLLG